jgi:integrase
MHSKVAAELLSWQSQAPAGDPAVFPWGTGAKVYAWLRPLCAKLDVRFTPHMGRHEFASRLNEVAKATTDDIVALGTWTSTANVQRYIHSTPEHTRALLEQL